MGEGSRIRGRVLSPDACGLSAAWRATQGQARNLGQSEESAARRMFSVARKFLENLQLVLGVHSRSSGQAPCDRSPGGPGASPRFSSRAAPRQLSALSSASPPGLRLASLRGRLVLSVCADILRAEIPGAREAETAQGERVCISVRCRHIRAEVCPEGTVSSVNASFFILRLPRCSSTLQETFSEISFIFVGLELPVDQSLLFADEIWCSGS